MGAYAVFFAKSTRDHGAGLRFLNKHGAGRTNIEKNGLQIRVLPEGSEITLIQK